MKRKIILCRGIQGSGKSTWAKRYCEEHPNTIRLNRDDIRKIPSFVRLSQTTANILYQNITLALGIKAIFLVLTLQDRQLCGWQFLLTWELACW